VSTRSPTSKRAESSSASSRLSASSSDSPDSRLPPGNSQNPARCEPARRRVTRKRPFSSWISPATTSTRLGNLVARAEALHGAGAAARLARRAPRRAEVHERLVEVVAAAARDERGGEIPELSLTAHARQPPGPHEDAPQDGRLVGVGQGGAPTARERGGGGGGGPPGPGRRAPPPLAGGRAPAVAGHGLARDRVEANGADVVAERVPEAPHGVDGR